MKLKKIFYINRCFITTDLLTYKKHYNTGAGGGVRSCGLGNESKKTKKSKNLLHIIMHSSPHLFMNVFLFFILLGINWHIHHLNITCLIQYWRNFPSLPCHLCLLCFSVFSPYSLPTHTGDCHATQQYVRFVPGRPAPSSASQRQNP